MRPFDPAGKKREKGQNLVICNDGNNSNNSDNSNLPRRLAQWEPSLSNYS